MDLRLVLLLLLWVFSGRAVYAQDASPIELELSGYSYITPVPVYLSEDDKRWLLQKRALRVGVYQPEQAPLVQTTLSGRYRGMNADYLTLIHYSLNVRIAVLSYKNRADAIRALRAGEIDTVLTGLDTFPFAEEGIQLSESLVHSWPVLVTSLSNVMGPLQSPQSTRIAVVEGYPGADFIHEAFPNAEIANYASYQEALNSVITGQNRWFMGDSLTTSTWLSQEFSLALSTVKYWPSPQKMSHFLFLPAQERLLNIINSTINAIDENQHGQIAQSMIDKGNLSFLLEPLNLTPREKQWLKTNKTLRVIINPWFAPYTMADNNQEVRGIVGDILNLISLQTGLQYETVVVNSHEDMLSEMKKGNWHIVQAATYDLSLQNALSFTHPFITTQFVTVVRKEDAQAIALKAGAHVAISADHPLLMQMKARHPDIHWQEVENASVALNLVATGKVDAAISNQLTARYLSEHYYPDRLTWLPLPEVQPAAISFAVPRSEPELRQILDKALDDIPQKEVLQIVGKWVRLPDVQIDTWELYNRPFYLVATLATLLVVSTLLWVLYLARQVRRRKESQRLLVIEKNKAQKANEEKRNFLSHMSHEIRTPVSAIVGFLELLQNSTTNLSPEDKTSVDHAVTASRSLLKLIGEILDLEKIESGLQEVMPKWVHVDAILKEKVLLFTALAAQKGIGLRYDSHLDPKEAMQLDPQMLGQVLMNLIGNAVKFTHHGHVQVSAKKLNHTLVISVNDTGPGISGEEQKSLFMPFSQGKMGEFHRGSGLGLAITKALMKQMGGTIDLQSELNQGTSVTLSLPVQISYDALTEVVETEPSPPPFIGKALRVLITDDHPSSRLLLKRQLASLGIAADEAKNGEEALRYLQQDRYDLLITDLNMPVMDGIALTREVRRFDSDLPIWGLTATAQQHERERCLAAGMTDCLFKPITLAQISGLLAGVSQTNGGAFDEKRLAVLAQGNRGLMLAALHDAQRENRHDLEAARVAARDEDYPSVKYHIHRLNGTAQLLGINEVITIAQMLEERLPDAVSAAELFDVLNRIESSLNKLDQAIEKFQQ
ncbi:hypothetical protein WP5S18E01_08090 [Enterobacter cloacae]|nr:hypothetical protein WP5S18E01_08090 [Enterobacter cloacae]